MRTLRRLFLALFTILVPAPLVAQGIIDPRPCGPTPRCLPGALCRVPPSCPWTGAVERTASRVRVELDGRVLRYEVEERFVNRGARLAEADYLFPLPEGAAFQDLRLSIDGELVAGETMDAARARGIYEEIVRRRRDPALVEWMGRGLLRARIFPIAAGEEKRVVVRFQMVAPREGDALRVDYVRASAPRAEAVADLRNLPIRPDTEVDYGVRPDRRERDGGDERDGRDSFVLTYSRDEPLGRPYSPTHALRVRDEGDRRVVEARGDAREVTLLLPLRRGPAAAISVLANAPGNEDGFALITLAPPAPTGHGTPRDVTFVLDVSGSMSGRKMEQARAAGRQLLATLDPQDRFRLIDFSTDVRTFRDDFVPATRANLAAAERYLDELEAQGSTNIEGALDEALRVRPAEGRLPLVLFVTDGMPTIGERRPDVLADLVGRRRGAARVFTFGLGADVNATLLERLAVDGRGTTQLVRPTESVERAVGVVASRLTDPVATDVRVRASGVRLRQVMPAGPVDVFAGEDLVLLARYEGSGRARITFEGTARGAPVAWSTVVDLPERDRANAFVPRLWATRRVGWLSAERHRVGGDTREIDDEIRTLGERYGIPTEFTSHLVQEPGVVAQMPARRAGATADAAAGGIAMAPAAAPAPQQREFERARTAAAQRSVLNLESVVVVEDTTVVRHVGTRRFTRAGDLWRDAGYHAGMRTVRVRPFSEAYFALLGRLPELEPVFALGERVLVAGRGVAVELADDGAERLDDAALAGLARAW